MAGHKIGDCGVGVICERVCIFVLVCMFESMQALLLFCVCSSVVVNEFVGVLRHTNAHTHMQ